MDDDWMDDNKPKKKKKRKNRGQKIEKQYNTKGKGKKRRFTMSQRRQIVRFYKNTGRQKTLTTYNIEYAQVKKWRKKFASGEWTNVPGYIIRRTKKKGLFHDCETQLNDLIKETLEGDAPVGRQFCKENMLRLVKESSERTEQERDRFVASDRWFIRFRRRWGWYLISIFSVSGLFAYPPERPLCHPHKSSRCKTRRWSFLPNWNPTTTTASSTWTKRRRCSIL